MEPPRFPSDRCCLFCRQRSVRVGRDGRVDYDDACIPDLPGVVFDACCGHGTPRRAKLDEGDRGYLLGEEALARLRVLGGNPCLAT